MTRAERSVFALLVLTVIVDIYEWWRRRPRPYPRVCDNCAEAGEPGYITEAEYQASREATL